MKALRDITAICCEALCAAAAAQAEEHMLKVSDGTHEIVFELNGSPAAQALQQRLPLQLKAENYSTNEKIAYINPELDPGQGNYEEKPEAGTLALFSPWGNLVMFYGEAQKYPGLFILGQARSGKDEIKNLSGMLEITSLSE